MTATNHAIFGSIIGLAISQPYLAIPLAFASHFYLDTLPHFGMSLFDIKKMPKFFRNYLLVEAILLISLVSLLLITSVPILVFGCLLAAISPDFVWGYRFLFLQNSGKKQLPPINKFNRWHAGIQKFESFKPGIFIELGFFMLFILIFLSLLL